MSADVSTAYFRKSNCWGGSATRATFGSSGVGVGRASTATGAGTISTPAVTSAREMIGSGWGMVVGGRGLAATSAGQATGAITGVARVSGGKEDGVKVGSRVIKKIRPEVDPGPKRLQAKVPTGKRDVIPMNNLVR